MRRRFLQELAYAATRLGLNLGRLAVQVLPRPWLFIISDGLANASFAIFLRNFRRRSTANLTIAMTESMDPGMARATARRSLRNFFRSCVEITEALVSTEGQLCLDTPIIGREYLDAALAKGNGVIVLSAHLGNFFLFGTRLAIEGYPVHVLVSPPRDPRFAQLMDELRLKVRQRTIRARPRRLALKELNAVLRRNQIAVVIADEFRQGHGIPVPMFGGTVNARRGPATIALRTGAAIVPALLVRRPDDGLQMIVEPELELERTARTTDDVRENTRRITRWLERTVRTYPDQWNWTNLHWQEAPSLESAIDGQKLQRLSH